MNSIFLFDHNTSVIDEVHFNLWLVGDKKFLDIGLKLNTNQQVELYLPWKQQNINDLYSKVSSPAILNAIFNEHLSVTANTNNNYVTIVRGGTDLDIVPANLIITPLEIHNHEFTKIEISAKYQTPNASYVRLRINWIPNGIFCNTHTGKDSFINPYREVTEVIDFRVNEMRVLPAAVFAPEGVHAPAITKLHFFLLKSYKEHILLASPDYLRCRELEDEAWDAYLDNANDKDDVVLAYHWTKSLSLGNHFAVLATFGMKKTSWFIVFIYAAVLILINISSSYIYGKLTESGQDSHIQRQKDSLLGVGEQGHK